MHTTSDWPVDSVEIPPEMQIPRMLLWKRTLILGLAGIGIGLAGGYLLGKSMLTKAGQANPADPSRPRITRVKFLPIPDADPGEVPRTNNDGENIQTWMPPAADSPVDSSEETPPRSKTRPALFRLENASPRTSDKG
jgi:hypothetical protein